MKADDVHMVHVSVLRYSKAFRGTDDSFHIHIYIYIYVNTWLSIYIYIYIYIYM